MPTGTQSLVFTQTTQANCFTARHWMFLPIERVTAPPAPPATPYRGVITLSGVAIINLQGVTPNDWRRERVVLDLGEDYGKALALAPWKPKPGHFFTFVVEQWVPFVTVNARYNRGPANNDGSAVDAFSLDPRQGNARINVDVAVRDSDAYIYRLGYTLTLYGYLQEQPNIG